MTAIDQAKLRDVRKVEAAQRTAQAKWARISKWSRTSTARWLNDRADAVNAASLRRGWQPTHRSDGWRQIMPRAPGYTLRDNHPDVFTRIHQRLSALASDEARESALVPEIVR